MPTLSDAQVRTIVRDELRDVHGAIAKLQAEIGKLEARLAPLSVIEQELHRLEPNVRSLSQHAYNIAGVADAVQTISQHVDIIHNRVKHAEELSQYTAGYVAMMLKERHERGL